MCDNLLPLQFIFEQQRGNITSVHKPIDAANLYFGFAIISLCLSSALACAQRTKRRTVYSKPLIAGIAGSLFGFLVLVVSLTSHSMDLLKTSICNLELCQLTNTRIVDLLKDILSFQPLILTIAVIVPLTPLVLLFMESTHFCIHVTIFAALGFMFAALRRQLDKAIVNIDCTMGTAPLYNLPLLELLLFAGSISIVYLLRYEAFGKKNSPPLDLTSFKLDL